MLAALSIALFFAATTPQGDVLAQVQVHGNTITSTEDILRLAGLTLGMSLTPDTMAEVETRLRRAGQFDDVEVRRRLASIADPSQVLLVIVVDEGPVRIEWNRDAGTVPRAVRRRGLPFLFMPVLTAEDGYGLTYGARFALPDVAGTRSRLSFPLTWGGERRAGAEFEKNFLAGPFTRLQAGGALERRVHPFFDQPETRRRAWLRAERAFTPTLRLGAEAGWERVRLLDDVDQFGRVGVDAIVDTRVDPFLSRNAVFGRAAWERIGLTEPVSRTELEAGGHLGLLGQSILVAHVLREDSSAALPPYLKSMLGGMGTLRGFKAGAAVGDTLVAGSLELRVPLTSPMSVGKLGVSAFVDAATVYDDGERLRGRSFERGAGGAVWFTAAMIRVNLAVARGVGGTTRVHFGTNLSF